MFVSFGLLSTWKLSIVGDVEATAMSRGEQCRPDQPGEWEQQQETEQHAFQSGIEQRHRGAIEF